MHDGNLIKELADALTRLQSSFDALSAVREKLGDTLEFALAELTRQINDVDTKLNPDCSYTHRS